MKAPDLERERSEQELSLQDFLASYNEDLPSEFPRASLSLLMEFRAAYPKLFKKSGSWTLGEHRKKFMDWLPQRLKLASHLS